MCLGERRNRPDTDLLAVEQGDPVRQRAAREEAGELRSQRSLGGLVLPGRELRRAEQLACAAEERRLQRGERQVPAVGGRVRLVAGQTAGEQRQRVPAEPVRYELGAPWVIDTTSRAPSPLRSRPTSAASTSVTARRAPAARSATCTGGVAGAVSASAPAQPRS